MNKLFYTLYATLLLFASTSSYAQKWQWAKTYANSSLSSSNTPVQITDAYGNTYITYSDTVINIDGHFKKGYGTSSTCLISFDCSGNYRWGKIIENSGPGGYIGYQLKTDDSGAIYLGLFIDARDSAALDEDAIVMPTNKNIVIIKYDTSGKYLWHIMPGGDSLGKDDFDFQLSGLSVAPNGDFRVLAVLPPGFFCDRNYSTMVYPYSIHMLEFDKDGHFQKGFPLNVSGDVNSLFENRILWDPADDVYYLYGSGSLFDTAHHASLVGKFNNSGHAIWVSSIPSPNNFFTPNMVIDPNGSLYINYSQTVIKMDKEGSVKWTINGNAPSAGLTNFAYADNKICISGANNYSSLPFEWGGKTIGNSFKTNPSVFLPDSTNNGTYFVTFDATTGTVLNIDSILGTSISPYSISGNKTGSFYILGSFGRSLFNTGSRHSTFSLPNLDTVQGLSVSTFFIKYGSADCSDTYVPISTPKNLSIYPNPASDYFIVENATLNGTVNVYNMLGQKIYTHSIDQASQTVPAAQFAPGMYMVEVIETDQHRSVSKIIKR